MFFTPLATFEKKGIKSCEVKIAILLDKFVIKKSQVRKNILAVLPDSAYIKDAIKNLKFHSLI